MSGLATGESEYSLRDRTRAMAAAKAAARLLAERDELLKQRDSIHDELAELDHELKVLQHSRAAALPSRTCWWGMVTNAIHQIIAAGPDEFSVPDVARVLAAPGGPCEDDLFGATMKVQRLLLRSKVYPVISGRHGVHKVYTKRGVAIPAKVVKPVKAPRPEEAELVSRMQGLRSWLKDVEREIKEIEDRTLLTGTKHGAEIRSLARTKMWAVVAWAVAHAPQPFSQADITDIICELGEDYRKSRFNWATKVKRYLSENRQRFTVVENSYPFSYLVGGQSVLAEL